MTYGGRKQIFVKRERTKWESGCFFRNAEALTGYLEQASDVPAPFVPVHTGE